MTNHSHQGGTHTHTPGRGATPHLSILMVNKDVPSAVVLQIGYLQAVGRADFSWLESGIDSVDLHYRFGLSGLHTRHFEIVSGIVTGLLVYNKNGHL